MDSEDARQPGIENCQGEPWGRSTAQSFGQMYMMSLERKGHSEKSGKLACSTYIVPEALSVVRRGNCCCRESGRDG